MPVSVTPFIRAQFGRSLLRGLRRVLSSDPGNTIAGQPVAEFLAGPSPSDPLGAFQHRSGRAICDRWSRGERAQILPGSDSYYRQLCSPYLGENMPGEPNTAPPFEGGQCPGVLYRVLFDVTEYPFANCQPNPVSRRQVDGVGPVKPLRFAVINPSGPLCTPGRNRVFVDFGSVLSANPRAGAGYGIDAVVVSVTRLDGQPDNCGSLPDDFDSGEPNPTLDPNPGPVGGPVGYPFPDLDIEVNVDGDVVVDFGDGTPPTVIDPTGEDDGSDGPPPGDLGEPGESQEADDDGNASGCAPDGSVLAALKVNFLEIPPKARQFAEGVYRAVCYAYLGTLEGLDLDPAGAVMRNGQFILAEKDNLTCWEVRANTGWKLSVTPYYRASEES